MESSATSQTEEDAPQTSPNPINQNTQEEPPREQWFSALNLTEGPTLHIQIAGMTKYIDLILVVMSEVHSEVMKQTQGTLVVMYRVV